MKKIIKTSLIHFVFFNLVLLNTYSQSLCPLTTNAAPSSPICPGQPVTLSVTQGSSSGPSNAINFNGSSSYARTPNLIQGMPTTAVTIELWFKAAGGGVIVDELGSGGGWHDSQIEILSTG